MNKTINNFPVFTRVSEVKSTSSNALITSKAMLQVRLQVPERQYFQSLIINTMKTSVFIGLTEVLLLPYSTRFFNPLKYSPFKIFDLNDFQPLLVLAYQKRLFRSKKQTE